MSATRSITKPAERSNGVSRNDAVGSAARDDRRLVALCLTAATPSPIPPLPVTTRRYRLSV